MFNCQIQSIFPIYSEAYSLNMSDCDLLALAELQHRVEDDFTMSEAP